MIIKFMPAEVLDTLKNNIPVIKKNLDLLGGPNLNRIVDSEIFLNSKIEIEDFTLDISSEKPSLTDIENIKKVFSKLNFLTETEASDERLWVGLTFGYFFDYMLYRWPINKIEDIKNHYFFSYSKQRSLMRHGLARLWWIGKLTYDKKRNNPFELTEFLMENSDFIESIFGRNFSSNHEIVKAMINALMDAKKTGVAVNRELVRDISKYLNLMGGIFIIDTWEYEEIYEKIMKKIIE